MKFLYLDSALKTNVGHHANFCRHIAGEAKRRGISVEVHASKYIAPALKAEFGATPTFSGIPSQAISSDPLCGFLESFEALRTFHLGDLRTISVSAEDTVFFNTVTAAKVMALLRWNLELARERRAPTIIADVGLGIRHANDAILYRYAGNRLNEHPTARVKLATFDPVTSQSYQSVFRRELATLPLPFDKMAPPRQRENGKPLTIGFLGHQRQDKGFQHVPGLVRRILRDLEGVTCLVHQAAADEQKPQVDALRELARNNSSLQLVVESSSTEGWVALLGQCDLIVLPYHPKYFAVAHSGIAFEAIASGIPLVVPRGTTMQASTARYGAPAGMFDEWNEESIFAAITTHIAQYDRHKAAALRAVEIWRRENGPRQFLDGVLALKEKTIDDDGRAA